MSASRRTAASCSPWSARMAPARPRCSAILAGITRARRRTRSSARGRRGRLGPAAGRSLPPADRGGEPAPVRAARGRMPMSTRRSRRCSTRPGSRSAATTRSRRCQAATSSGSTSRSACWPSRRCCCSTSPAPASTRGSESGSGSSSPGWRRAARRSSTRPTRSRRPSHYGDRLLVLADGEALFDGTFPELRKAVGREGRRRRPGGRLRRVPREARATERALAAAQGPADPQALAAADRRCWSSIRSCSPC